MRGSWDASSTMTSSQLLYVWRKIDWKASSRKSAQFHVVITIETSGSSKLDCKERPSANNSRKILIFT